MRALITGGAGFIGVNLARRLADLGWEVVVFDDLSRPGASWNARGLEDRAGVELIRGDVRDRESVERVVSESRFDAVFHEAAQVAVTSSVRDPRLDFEVNALGTLNLLEAVRLSSQEPVLVFASTNKVYGDLGSNRIIDRGGGYGFADAPDGVSEDTPLDLRSPYGCSKGCADQYVLDYRRVFGLRTVVFRQSCIYGPRQLGVEDQGWMAWFALCAALERPITIYGDGKQVRDVLHVDDLVDLYLLAVEREPELDRFAFNVGGGPRNAVSLLEVIALLEEMVDRRLDVRFSEWRPADQRVYVSDIRRAGTSFGWEPRIGVREGLRTLVEWMRANAVTLGRLIDERRGAEVDGHG